MKILRTRAASVSRQGLCTALLVASLTTAAVGASPPHNAADGTDPSPGPDNPQSRPHGTPDLTLPDLVPPPGGTVPGSTPGDTPDGSTGIPATALAAYRNAERIAASRWPGCHIKWELVAGIGKVESEHGTMEGRRLNADGSTDRKILGPRLTGGQFATVTDTDQGRWDDDAQYDRAVGPTQFIPSTWQSFGTDGNGDGVANPNNIFDAAASTARYLCAGNRNMDDAGDLDKAILSYNPSREYVNAVVAWMRTYQHGGAGSLPDTGVPTPTSPAPSWPGTTPAPSRPSTPSTPSTPSKPRTPTTPTTPSKPGGGDHGTDKPKPPKPPTTPVVDRLERVGEESLEATAGETFAERPKVRALDTAGKPAPAGTRITFEIIGLKTGARFEDGKRTATLTVDKNGEAVSPEILAGDRAGDFTIRAEVEGKNIGVDFAATVKAPTADKLVRPGKGEPLTATANTAFAQKLVVQALGKSGKPVAGTKATATVLASDGTALPAGVGPYFKDAAGKPVRTLALPAADEDGLISVPQLTADQQAGTFLLRLTTAEGKILDVTLTVTPAAAKTPTTPATTPAPTPKATSKKN
ncbi:lytic transglycosylase domain-containing protein [Streptomyces sp. NPDC049577]|uniref:lytic transglycosylase domain-containing protein n=1 Tax=Streptomyces sp. NPDC049577 TaxID=3155153 RepID=UPI003436D3F9